MATQTPIENAYKEWRKLRPRYMATRYPSRYKEEPLSQADVRRYFWLRGHRHTTKNWRRSGKDVLVGRIRKSVAETQAWLDHANAVEQWLSDVAVKLGEMNEHNAQRHLFMFIEKVQGYIDHVADEMPDGPIDGLPDEEVLDIFKEEVSSFFSTLGLVENEEWNERDDGCLWFTDEVTGENYHFSFVFAGFRYDVSSFMIADPRYASRWRDYPIVDLAYVAQLSTKQLRDVTRPMRDYFGIWDGITSAIRRTEVPLPEGVKIRGID